MKMNGHDFGERWQFPNCIGGAIDGKHVVMQAPPRFGSMFYNYKGSHSIVLIAVVNSSYEFIMVDIGEAGRQIDGGVFAASHLGVTLNENKLNIPTCSKINGSDKTYNYVIVGDEAFPLKPYFVKNTKGLIELNV